MQPTRTNFPQPLHDIPQTPSGGNVKAKIALWQNQGEHSSTVPDKLPPDKTATHLKAVNHAPYTPYNAAQSVTKKALPPTPAPITPQKTPQKALLVNHNPNPPRNVPPSVTKKALPPTPAPTPTPKTVPAKREKNTSSLINKTTKEVGNIVKGALSITLQLSEQGINEFSGWINPPNHRILSTSNAAAPKYQAVEQKPQPVQNAQPVSAAPVAYVKKIPTIDEMVMGRTYFCAYGRPIEISSYSDTTAMVKVKGGYCKRYVRRMTAINFGQNAQDTRCYWECTKPYLDFMQTFADHWQTLPQQDPGIPTLEPAPGQIPGLNFMTPWTVLAHMETHLAPILNKDQLKEMRGISGEMTGADFKPQSPTDVKSLASNYRSLPVCGLWSRNSQKHTRLAYLYASACCNMLGPQVETVDLEILGSYHMLGVNKGYWSENELQRLCPGFRVNYWFLNDSEIAHFGLNDSANWEIVPPTAYSGSSRSPQLVVTHTYGKDSGGFPTFTNSTHWKY